MTITLRRNKGVALTHDEVDDNFTHLNNAVPISVKQAPYNAVGDGVTDDTAAIQAALNTGNRIYCPAGTYLISNALTVTASNTGLVGDGRGTIIKTSSGTADIFTIGDGTNEISGLQFRDFRLWATVAKSAGYAFNCRLTSDSVWEEVRAGSVDDYTTDGHRLYNGYYFDRFSQLAVLGGEIVVSNDALKARGKSDQSFGAELSLDDGLRIYVAGAKAVWLGGACGGVHLGRVDISSCRYGLYIDDTLQSGVPNREAFVSPSCTIDSCTGWGINLESNAISFLEIDGAWIAGNGGAVTSEGGIRVAPSSTAVVPEIRMTGAVVYSNYYDGVQINEATLVITGCIVRNNGTDAAVGGHGINIASSDVTRSTIHDNYIHSNGNGVRGYGTTIAASTDNFSVQGNNFTGNGQAAINNDAGISATKIIQNNLGYNSSWVGYTPTVTAAAGTITTASATGRWWKVDRTVHFQQEVTITTNGTGATAVRATLPPFTPAANFVIAGRENNATGNLLCGLIPSAGTYVSITNYDNSYPGADGRLLILSGSYEATT